MMNTSQNTPKIKFITIVSSSEHVRNEEVLLRVNEHRNILHEIRKRKANWMVISYVETAF